MLTRETGEPLQVSNLPNDGGTREELVDVLDDDDETVVVAGDGDADDGENDGSPHPHRVHSLERVAWL